MNALHKVLIVVDDPAVTKNLEQALSAKGCAVETTSSGEDALWKLENDGYDAVFTEMALRGLSGLDLAEEAHARQLRQPVIIITGADSSAAQERAKAAGVAGFLRKPLASKEVADVVDQVIKTAEARRPKIPEAKVAAAPFTVLFARRLRNVVLFLAAPVFGLVYILIFPIVGLGAFVWFGVNAIRGERKISDRVKQPEPAPALATVHGKPNIVKAIAMIIGAAVVGLAYGIVGPILGIGALIWFAFEAWGKLGAKAMRASET